MATSIRENGLMIINKVMEFTNGLMEAFIKENG